MIFSGKENVFEQIANNYKKLISTGVLKYGEYLPSCRDLARELGINPNTVQKAYTLLEDDGYVTKVVKKGVFVSYGNDNNVLVDSFKESVNNLLSSGYKKEEIIELVNSVCEGEKNDRN